MEVSTRSLLFALGLYVIVCVAVAQPVDNSLEKMGQASGDVMAIVQELKDKMYAEEGFEVSEMLALLDRFCEERQIIEDLEQEVESNLAARRQRRSDCKWTTKCSFNHNWQWECSIQLKC